MLRGASTRVLRSLMGAQAFNPHQMSNHYVKRSFFRGPPSRWDPFNDWPSSVVRDFERGLTNMSRLFPTSSMPAMSRLNILDDHGFKVQVDLRHYKPEDIKLTLKEDRLEIEARMEHKDEVGNRVYQEVNKVVKVPDNVDLDKLKSFLDEDGLLVVEAPYITKKENEVKEIPVNKLGKEDNNKD